MTEKTNFETGLLAIIEDYLNWLRTDSENILQDELAFCMASGLRRKVASSIPGYYHEVADDIFKIGSDGLLVEEISFARSKYLEEIAEAGSRLFDLMRCENFEQAA